MAGRTFPMSCGRLAAAIAAGLTLAVLPFLHYAPLGSGRAAHADHEPHHGGQLGMVGDRHIEFVRRAESVDVFVTDAWRRPIQPRTGFALYDGGRTVSLRWRDDRLTGANVAGAQHVRALVVLQDATELAVDFDLTESPAIH